MCSGEDLSGVTPVSNGAAPNIYTRRLVVSVRAWAWHARGETCPKPRGHLLLPCNLPRACQTKWLCFTLLCAVLCAMRAIAIPIKRIWYSVVMQLAESLSNKVTDVVILESLSHKVIEGVILLIIPTQGKIGICAKCSACSDETCTWGRNKWKLKIKQQALSNIQTLNPKH